MEPEPIYDVDQDWKPTAEDIAEWRQKEGWVSFDDFTFDHMAGDERKTMQAAITAANDFCQQRNENPGRAFIVLASGAGDDNLRSGYGCGKTMLARCIYYAHGSNYYAPGAGKKSLSGTVDGRFYEARELMAIFDEDGYEPAGLFRQFGKLIVIDDVGREGSLRWEKRDPDAQLAEKQSRYYNVIDHCYRRGISIVITSNLNSRQLAAFLGGASWSRLLQMAPPAYRVNLTGLPDMRPQLAGF